MSNIMLNFITYLDHLMVVLGNFAYSSIFNKYILINNNEAAKNKMLFHYLFKGHLVFVYCSRVIHNYVFAYCARRQSGAWCEN